MNIPRLGPLTPDATIPEWLVSQPIAVPWLCGEKLKFTLDGLEEVDESDARSAIEAFLALGPDARRTVAPYIFTNYRQIAEVVSEEDLGCRIAAEQDVWSHITFSEVFVSRRRRRDKAIYVQIMAECGWEPEHGLQLVYRGGKALVRVSEQDGHLTYTDAYDLPEAEARIVEGPTKATGRVTDPPSNPWWKLW